LPATEAVYAVHADGRVARVSAPLDRGLLFLSSVQTSADGRFVIYTTSTLCPYSNSSHACRTFTPSSKTYLFRDGGTTPEEFTGLGRISANGQYMWLPGERWDLQTDARVSVPIQPAGVRQQVTDSGELLGFDADSTLQLWNPRGRRALVKLPGLSSAIVSDDGTVVVYYVPGQGLHSIDLRSSVHHSVAEGWILSYSVSSDGSRICYLPSVQEHSARQVWLVRPDGSGKALLTGFAEGVGAAVIDGSGAHVIALVDGAVVKVGIETARVDQLVPKSLPVCSKNFSCIAPGSIYSMSGTLPVQGSYTAGVPLGRSLAGMRVLLDGEALPVLSVAAGGLWFQVPFEAAIRDTATLEVEHTSLFERCPPMQVPVRARCPYFSQDGVTGLIAYHQDFRSLVSKASPAQAGEVLHTFAVGLGAVTPGLETGVPAPLDRLHRLLGPFDCTIGPGFDQGQLVEVLFAGLVPGTIGVYQVDFRVPSPVPPRMVLTCGTPLVPSERNGGLLIQ
jgi:uncharacterized protein (TIGR03437 family)